MKKNSYQVENQKIIIAALISSKLDIEKFLNPFRKKLTANGNEIVGELIQRRGVSRSKKVGGSKNMDVPLNPKTILGSGKILELKKEVANKQPELVIFLNQLNETQKQIIEDIIECKIAII